MMKEGGDMSRCSHKDKKQDRKKKVPRLEA